MAYWGKGRHLPGSLSSWFISKELPTHEQELARLEELGSSKSHASQQTIYSRLVDNRKSLTNLSNMLVRETELFDRIMTVTGGEMSRTFLINNYDESVLSDIMDELYTEHRPSEEEPLTYN